MHRVNNVSSPKSNSFPSNNGHSNTTKACNFIQSTAAPAFRVKKSKRTDKNPNNLSSKDIGTPVNYRHILHVGWDSAGKALDVTIEDADLRAFLERDDVSVGQLNDGFTRKFLHDFIEQHGVVHLVKRFANNANSASAVPPLAPPFLSAFGNGPPAVPTRTSSIRNSNYRESTTRFTPAPAPSIPEPPVRTTSICIQDSLTPNRQSGLFESCGAPCGSSEPVPDDRSQLMTQIQRGIQLKKVDTNSLQRRLGGISDCLCEIQKGVDLKHIPEQARTQPSIEDMEGLAGALARVLASRHKALQDSDSSEDDTNSEYEWE